MIDPETEKHLKDLGAALALLQNEIGELKKNPAANAAQISMFQKEIADLRDGIKALKPEGPVKDPAERGFFHTMLGPFAD